MEGGTDGHHIRPLVPGKHQPVGRARDPAFSLAPSNEKADLDAGGQVTTRAGQRQRSVARLGLIVYSMLYMNGVDRGDVQLVTNDSCVRQRFLQILYTLIGYPRPEEVHFSNRLGSERQ